MPVENLAMVINHRYAIWIVMLVHDCTVFPRNHGAMTVADLFLKQQLCYLRHIAKSNIQIDLLC